MKVSSLSSVVGLLYVSVRVVVEWVNWAGEEGTGN